MIFFVGLFACRFWSNYWIRFTCLMYNTCLVYSLQSHYAMCFAVEPPSLSDVFRSAHERVANWNAISGMPSGIQHITTWWLSDFQNELTRNKCRMVTKPYHWTFILHLFVKYNSVTSLSVICISINVCFFGFHVNLLCVSVDFGSKFGIFGT